MLQCLEMDNLQFKFLDENASPTVATSMAWQQNDNSGTSSEKMCIESFLLIVNRPALTPPEKMLCPGDFHPSSDTNCQLFVFCLLCAKYKNLYLFSYRHSYELCGN